MPIPIVLERGPKSKRFAVQREMRSWTLPFLIRHSAFHTLDHAWEMQDRDLTAGR